MQRGRQVVLGVLAIAAFVAAVHVWQAYGPRHGFPGRNGFRGAGLRLVVGRCTSAQRNAHVAGCRYIDEHPAVVLAGPLDENGIPFRVGRIDAGGSRTIDVGVPPGSYRLVLDIGGDRTIATTVPRDALDVAPGPPLVVNADPASPWQLEAIASR